jgi:hypothetical protein
MVNRRGDVDWWNLELVVTVVLVAVVLVLGPLIKRFGRSYAADVFRANPRTGKSYMVLMDIAYYLIFTAYILFTATFQPPRTWDATVSAAQIEDSLVRLGGMLLIMGVLHGLNVLSLPVIGRLLGFGRDLARSAVAPPPGSAAAQDPHAPGP